MAKKSKLFAALDEHRGIDHKLEKQKKLQKQAAKRRRSKEQENGSTKLGQFDGIKPLMSGALQPEGDDASEWESEGELDAAPVNVRTIPQG